MYDISSIKCVTKKFLEVSCYSCAKQLYPGIVVKYHDVTSFTCSVHLRSSLSRVPNNLNFLTLHGGNNHLLGLSSFSISVLINHAQILV